MNVASLAHPPRPGEPVLCRDGKVRHIQSVAPLRLEAEPLRWSGELTHGYTCVFTELRDSFIWVEYFVHSRAQKRVPVDYRLEEYPEPTEEEVLRAESIAGTRL